MQVKSGSLEMTWISTMNTAFINFYPVTNWRLRKLGSPIGQLSYSVEKKETVDHRKNKHIFEYYILILISEYDFKVKSFVCKHKKWNCRHNCQLVDGYFVYVKNTSASKSM